MLLQEIPTQARSESPRLQPALRTIELLGPAGAGKTTLLNSLRESHLPVDDHLVVPLPDKFLVLGSLVNQLLPCYLFGSSKIRLLTLEELRRIYYVNAWHRVLTGSGMSKAAITVLDHGPLFMLGMIQEFGPDVAQNRNFKKLLDASITAWSDLLDAAVWLDAPNPILIQRIESRPRHHVIKGKSFREATIFLDDCRRSFESILCRMTSTGRVKVLRFDTSKMPVQNIADEIILSVDTQSAASQRNTFDGLTRASDA